MLDKTIFRIVGLLPCYILGTFFVNINILLIITSGSILFKGKDLSPDVDKLVALFFYILISGLWNTVEINFLNQSLNKNYYILGKSLFLRYFFIFIYKTYFENNFLNFVVFLFR